MNKTESISFESPDPDVVEAARQVIAAGKHIAPTSPESPTTYKHEAIEPEPQDNRVIRWARLWLNINRNARNRKGN